MGEGQEEEEVLLALREEGLDEGLCQQIIRDLGYDTLSVLGTLAMVKEEEIKNRFDEPWRFGDVAKLKLVAKKIKTQERHRGQKPAIDPKQVCCPPVSSIERRCDWPSLCNRSNAIDAYCWHCAV